MRGFVCDRLRQVTQKNTFVCDSDVIVVTSSSTVATCETHPRSTLCFQTDSGCVSFVIGAGF